ncbi:MAG: methyltransferase domain-containing protein, partial [Betaproteobacteria bacterium]
PLPSNRVDVIISNCVINLSGDKRRVLAEAFRVLRPGGRFAVSDVVVRGAVPADVRRFMELWVGCVAGALEEGPRDLIADERGAQRGQQRGVREATEHDDLEAVHRACGAHPTRRQQHVDAAPDPRSSTTSPSRSSASAVGLPQPSDASRA